MNHISPSLFLERPLTLLRLHEPLEELCDLEVGVRRSSVVRLQGLQLLGQLDLALLSGFHLDQAIFKHARQGDTSGCSLGFVDIKILVVF